QAACRQATRWPRTAQAVGACRIPLCDRVVPARSGRWRAAAKRRNDPGLAPVGHGKPLRVAGFWDVAAFRRSLPRRAAASPPLISASENEDGAPSAPSPQAHATLRPPPAPTLVAQEPRSSLGFEADVHRGGPCGYPSERCCQALIPAPVPSVAVARPRPRSDGVP